MPLIQIIIPAYNVAPFIQATLDSVIKQTFTDWEAIILDDCSSDDTAKIASKYTNVDSRISFIKNETNLGMIANWNKGISLINAKYFVKLDADDIWHPNSLSEAVKIMENDPTIGLVAAKFQEIDEYGNPKNTQSIFPDFDLHKNGKFSTLSLVKKGPIGMFSYGISMQGILLIRMSIITKAGFYMDYTEADQEMWFRLGAHSHFFYIPEIRYYYRKWSQSHSSMVDRQLSQKGFFNTRTYILNYYFKQKLLTKNEYKAFLGEATFVYNSFLIYKARMNGQYVEMLRHLFHNFSIFPKKTMLDNLHINRLWGKN